MGLPDSSTTGDGSAIHGLVNRAETNLPLPKVFPRRFQFQAEAHGMERVLAFWLRGLSEGRLFAPGAPGQAAKDAG
jgi:hypothetical protein